MKWLLYDSFRIETTHPAPVVVSRLEARVDDIDSELPEQCRALFQGKVWGDGFRVWRLAAHKNLFSPLIRGTVLPTPGGAIVEVRMRPHGFVLACLSIWYGVAFLLPLYSVWTGQLGAGRWVALCPGLLIFAPLVWVVAAVLFGYEARRGREVLTEVILGAEPSAAPDRGDG